MARLPDELGFPYQPLAFAIFRGLMWEATWERMLAAYHIIFENQPLSVASLDAP